MHKEQGDGIVKGAKEGWVRSKVRGWLGSHKFIYSVVYSTS